MPRDKALEAVIAEDLGDRRGLTSRAMFGGLAWMLQGRLLCAVGRIGLLARLGRETAAGVPAHPEIAPAVFGGRPMRGWVLLSPEGCANDALRQELLEGALRFVRTLPPA